MEELAGLIKVANRFLVLPWQAADVPSRGPEDESLPAPLFSPPQEVGNAHQHEVLIPVRKPYCNYCQYLRKRSCATIPTIHSLNLIHGTLIVGVPPSIRPKVPGTFWQMADTATSRVTEKEKSGSTLPNCLHL